MDFFDIVHKRYSHKDRFLPDAIPIDDLELIAKTGLSAPSGNNSQCVRLVLLPERNCITPLYEICQTTGLETTPAAIALFTDTSLQTGKFNFETEDYAAATQNILLAATATGYASLWLDFPWLSNEENHKKAHTYLNAPESCRLRVVILIGKPDGPGSRREKIPLEKRLFYEKYFLQQPTDVFP
jgi:nitroreductase